jgi:hypothetical protein
MTPSALPPHFRFQPTISQDLSELPDVTDETLDQITDLPLPGRTSRAGSRAPSLGPLSSPRKRRAPSLEPLSSPKKLRATSQEPQPLASSPRKRAPSTGPTGSPRKGPSRRTSRAPSLDPVPVEPRAPSPPAEPTPYKPSPGRTYAFPEGDTEDSLFTLNEDEAAAEFEQAYPTNGPALGDLL